MILQLLTICILAIIIDKYTTHGGMIGAVLVGLVGALVGSILSNFIANGVHLALIAPTFVVAVSTALILLFIRFIAYKI